MDFSDFTDSLWGDASGLAGVATQVGAGAIASSISGQPYQAYPTAVAAPAVTAANNSFLLLLIIVAVVFFAEKK